MLEENRAVGARVLVSPGDGRTAGGVHARQAAPRGVGAALQRGPRRAGDARGRCGPAQKVLAQHLAGAVSSSEGTGCSDQGACLLRGSDRFRLGLGCELAADVFYIFATINAPELWLASYSHAS
jgi:hypothetical protein